MREITGIDPTSYSGSLSTYIGDIMRELFPEGIMIPIIFNNNY